MHLSAMQRIFRKEMQCFFTSPMGYLFLGSFAAVCMFVFFWVESFFARNIVDVRPLFEWMPVLLIFLCAALSMRMWSEERKSGTLEQVITLPQPLWHFVIGKYLACMGLLVLALVLTLPLVLSVSFLGTLDWGPVWAGYLATILLGSGYLSIGLFVSARTDNQIISLIVTTLICGGLYLIGSPVITGLANNMLANIFSAFGTGSRFVSITRGIIDFRDLYYYASLTGVFLVLNIFALERERWSEKITLAQKHWLTVLGLSILNIIIANIWLYPIVNARQDVTHGKIYSLSSATKTYLADLKEPLLIRAYISSKTHPLLAPLLPQLKDLLREYEIAGKGKIRFEWIDPAQSPDLEEEANSKYGIKPVPFQINDKYQASLVNSYFDVLIQYGNEYQILGFKDLIEIKSATEMDIDVQLRNPEYDITRTIKKVLYGFQSGGDIFEQIGSKVTFTGYISNDEMLPEALVKFKSLLKMQLEENQKQSKGRLAIHFEAPEANQGQVAKQLQENYGFRPMATSIIDTKTFYFYMLLSDGQQTVLVPIPESLDQDGFQRSFESSLKRFAKGFMKTIALVTPENDPMGAQFGLPQKQFNLLEQMLRESFNVRAVSLIDGRVPEETDLLLLVAPHSLDLKQLYAIDQFLMQGGTVVANTAPFSAQLSQNGLSLMRHNSGLQNWLAHHGINIEKLLVLDPQNMAFPLPITREINGVSFQELHMMDYPYFVDVRPNGLNQDNPITSGLPQVSVPWVSPIKVEASNQELIITPLIHSSKQSWVSDNLDILPKYAPGDTYLPEGRQQQNLLGVSLEGRFSTYFDEAPDFSQTVVKDENEAGSEAQNATSEPMVTTKINQSPKTSKLVVFASNEFLEDNILQLSGVSTGTDYLSPLQVIMNTLDWSLADDGLLGIRARSHFNKTLPSLTREDRMILEYGNYAVSLIFLIFIGFLNRKLFRRREKIYASWLKMEAA